LDPIATGLVASLAKPGGNITGVTSVSAPPLVPRATKNKQSRAHRSKKARVEPIDLRAHSIWDDRVRGQATSQRISQLDGLRGIAILLVLAWHYGHAIKGDPFAALFTLAWSGVDLFFVLSGFLLGGILIDHRNSASYFTPFYARRFFRIVPIYLLVLVIGRMGDDGDLSLGWYLSFTQNLYMAARAQWDIWQAQTWSLAVEEQFYLMLPLIIRFVPRKSLAHALVALVVAAPISRLLLFLLAGESALVADAVLLPCRMDCLLLGVLCAYLLREPHWRKVLSESIPALKWFAAILLGLLLLCANRGRGFNSVFMAVPGLTLIAALYAILLLIVLLDSGLLTRLMKRPVLRQFGTWAYCIYLIHILVPTWLFSFLLGRRFVIDDGLSVALFFASFAAVIACAALSWRYIEAPLIRLGHRYRYSD
jgi:peptidoglycan/LPS O-acetylase OafA/YrhL